MKLAPLLLLAPALLLLVGCPGAGSTKLQSPAVGEPWPDAFVDMPADGTVVWGCIGFSAEQVLSRVAARRTGWELAVVLGGPDELAGRLVCVSGEQTWPAPVDEVRAWLAGPAFPLDLSESVRTSLDALAAEHADALAKNQLRYAPPEVQAYAAAGDEALARARQAWVDAMRERTPQAMGGQLPPEGKMGVATTPTAEALLAGPPGSLAARLAEAVGPLPGVQVIDAPVIRTQAVGRLRLGALLGERAGLVLEGLELPAPFDEGFVQVRLGSTHGVAVTLRTGPALEAAHVFLAGPAVPWPPGPDHREEKARAGDVLVVPLPGNRVRVAARGLVFDSHYVRSFGPVEVALDQPAPP